MFSRHNVEHLISGHLLNDLAEFVTPIVEDFMNAGFRTLDEIKQAIVHRLRAGVSLGLPHLDGSGMIHHPLPLQDRGGNEVALAHRAGEQHGRTFRLLRVGECEACVDAVSQWSPPPFDPSLPIGWVAWAHIIDDHPERLGGLSKSQLRPRLNRAVRELRTSLSVLAERDDIAAYFFLRNQHWCWVAPLYPTLYGEAVAAVLVLEEHQHRLVTVLPRQKAASNVRSLGVCVPSWLEERIALAS